MNRSSFILPFAFLTGPAARGYTAHNTIKDAHGRVRPRPCLTEKGPGNRGSFTPQRDVFGQSSGRDCAALMDGRRLGHGEGTGD